MQNEFDKLFSNLRKNWIGFDTVFADIQNGRVPTAQTYPPYNIVQTGENSFAIEMAVAGMAQEDIEISVEKNLLTVKGTPAEESKDYITKGIASRSFQSVYKLGNGIEVASADMRHGMLVINLRDMTEKPERKVIPIGGQSEGPMLLQE